MALWACKPEPQSETVPNDIAVTTSKWWGIHFFVDWPEAEEPRWHIDELIAEEAVRPTLIAHSDELSLWRFHRRAQRDGTGHRFRFLYWTSHSLAWRIYREVTEHIALRDLSQMGLLLRIAFVEAAGPNQSGIEATSDPRWPPELQRSWPYYLMGASRMWLDLLDQYAARYPGRPHDELLYRDIHRQVSDLWRTWGQHAWLHHLEALYAYETPCPERRSSAIPPPIPRDCPNGAGTPPPSRN